MSTTRNRVTRQLLHPATLIAVPALIIATSSTAYAIVITGKQIKDGTVTGIDIDIKNSSIGAIDLAPTAKGARAVATICSLDSNGGFNSLYQFSCDVGTTGAHKVRLRTIKVDENTTGSPTAHDPTETIPAVVVIP